MNTDKMRAAIVSTLLSLLPVLQLAGIINLDADGVSIVSLFINNTVTMLFLLLPNPPADG